MNTPGHASYRLTGLDCPDCSRIVSKSVERVPGVLLADVNFASGVMTIEYESGTDPRERVVQVVRSIGHGVEQLSGVGPIGEADTRADASSWRIGAQEVSTILAGALLLTGWFVGRWQSEWAVAVSVAAYAFAIAAAGWLMLRRAMAALRSRTLDMNVLMTVAVLGAAGIGEWAEGAAVVFLFSLGSMLESRSLERTRRSIRDLMELRPPLARVLTEHAEEEVPASEVAPGAVVIVRPGERLPLDGVVERGLSAVDESPITGESVPVEKAVGERVFAGSVNTTGILEVRVTSRAEDSTLARIIFMVEEAQALRAPSQRLVDRFSSYYTPIVIGFAIAIATLPPLFGLVSGMAVGGFNEWFYRALVILVVSCPCALVISTPVSIVSAMTRATRDGVLVKGGVHLETAARLRAVAFDKTGTLTSGHPEVTDVIPLNGEDAASVLAVAAILEANSNHPIARAVSRAAGDLRRVEVSAFEDVPGQGVRGVVDGVRYAVGSTAFAAEEGVLDVAAVQAVERLEIDGRTVLLLLQDGRAAGVIGVADRLRPEAPGAVAAILDGGVGHTVMLTGDNERTAAAVAAHVGVSDHRARLMPKDKVDAVGALRDEYGAVAMVGDGINDAPALAASDLGIAMGVAGSDAALEIADVALMSDDLSQVPHFLELGRRMVAIIRQNVIASVAVKLTVLVLAVAGVATLWMAVFADTGISLLVTLNGMRLLRRGADGA